MATGSCQSQDYPGEETVNTIGMQYACASTQIPSTGSVPEDTLPWLSSFDPDSLSKEEWDLILRGPVPVSDTGTIQGPEAVVVQDSGVNSLTCMENSNHLINPFVWNGVDLLKYLESANKDDPGKGALKLMDIIFTDEEMSSSCFKPESKRFSKPGLDEERVKLIEDSLFQYYGDKYTSIKQYVVKRCNQKCRDRARDKNKPRRSSGKKRQQKSTLELQVESLLYGQQQLMRAMTDLSFPAVHYDVPTTESFIDLPDPNSQLWNLDQALPN